MGMDKYEKHFINLNKFECGNLMKINIALDDERYLNRLYKYESEKYIDSTWIYYSDNFERFESFIKKSKIICENAICLTKNNGRRKEKSWLDY